MKIIQKAGAIVFGQKDPSLIALLYRSKEKDWSFPKGHIEEGEAVAETTQREIMEETGMSTQLINDPLPPLEYNHPKGYHIIVYMFLMQSEKDDAVKIEFEGDKIIWVPFKEVVNKLSYDNVRQYYISIFKIVESAVITLQSKIR